YYAGETKEIRLYLHGDDDVVRVSGGSAKGMIVRVSGGDGKDTVENQSINELWAYDEGDRTSLIGSTAPRWIRRHAKRPKPWGRTGPLSPDWGHRWLPKFAFPYSTDLGPLVYMGAVRIGYGFLQNPHRSLLSFGGGYAPLEQKFVADVEYTVRNLLPGVHGSLRAEYTGIEILHFYGLGNDSKETLSPDFYELGRELLRVAPGVTLAAGRNVEIDVGLQFEVSHTDDDPDEPNLVAITNPYGSGTFLQAGARVAAWFDTRDRTIAPTRGLRVGMWGDAYPGVLDLDGGAIARAGGELAAYGSLTDAGNQTLAIRVAGEKVFGTFPYYESAFLGGPDRLRGFTEERFAGDASVFASGELRLFVGHLNMLLPWHVGVFGFGDVGRVYLDGQSPGGWHTSSGGGIWLAPLYRQFTVSATIARSAEGTFLYVGAGFGI
ncbi:MAG: BamA/TamA family outer membrane protein, partial [Rhodothermales bacterium]|nr:BamA/TamA family outer membrane protein [Rhodothermales bacterium]